MRSDHADQPNNARIPATFLQHGAPLFWLAALCTGIGAGISAILLTRFLEIVQHYVWAGSGTHILDAAVSAWYNLLQIPATAWKRQGPLSVAVYRRGCIFHTAALNS
jgi:hypothetical protein